MGNIKSQVNYKKKVRLKTSKILRYFVFILCLYACQSPIAPTDYIGQAHPGVTPVVFAPDIVSVKGRLEHGLSFTPDTQELAFGVLNKNDGGGRIFYAKKMDEKWTLPEVFEPLKGEDAYLPYFSPNGKTLVYTKNRAGTNNGITDIWVLNKSNNNWWYTQKINNPISTSTREASACATLKSTLYFSSNRNGNGLADLYFSTLDNGRYSNAERIDIISSERDEESIFVAPDERYIIFSRYATNENGPDLFISYRDSKKNWTQAVALDSAINTSNWQRRPFVSFDNKFLFFTTLIFNDSGLAESDIYWVNTQKVFKPYVFNAIIEKTFKMGEKTEISIPSDYFKDIDHDKLDILINHDKPEWAEFDAKKMILTANPNVVGEFDIIFTAVDPFSNKTSDTLKIKVEK